VAAALEDKHCRLVSIMQNVGPAGHTLFKVSRSFGSDSMLREVVNEGGSISRETTLIACLRSSVAR